MFYTRRYIIIENIKKPIYQNINMTINKNSYVIGKKNDLKNFVPKRLLDKIFKNHLYQNLSSAYNDYNNWWGLHRLVCSLYTNIDDRAVHHINKEKATNDITNLLPVTNKEHIQLEDYDQDGILAQKMQLDFKKKIHRLRSFTVANNDDVILQILKFSNEGMPPDDIIKTMSKYVKKSSVYAILKDFSYIKELLEALENNNIIDVSEFDGIMRERWRKIIEFEKFLI